MKLDNNFWGVALQVIASVLILATFGMWIVGVWMYDDAGIRLGVTGFLVLLLGVIMAAVGSEIKDK